MTIIPTSHNTQSGELGIKIQWKYYPENLLKPPKNKSTAIKPNAYKPKALIQSEEQVKYLQAKMHQAS